MWYVETQRHSLTRTGSVGVLPLNLVGHKARVRMLCRRVCAFITNNFSNVCHSASEFPFVLTFSFHALRVLSFAIIRSCVLSTPIFPSFFSLPEMWLLLHVCERECTKPHFHVSMHASCLFGTISSGIFICFGTGYLWTIRIVLPMHHVLVPDGNATPQSHGEAERCFHSFALRW